MNLLDTVCTLTGASAARRRMRLQSLWRGYGEVVMVELTGGPASTVVVKHVRPPAGAHPRKLRSYEVETAWYRQASHQGPRIPAWFGSTTAGHERIVVLEDLHAAGFTRTLSGSAPRQVDAALGWLAHLHATHLGPPPAHLWPVGTYWHLGTRQAELAATPDRRWQVRAPVLDQTLRNARYQTVVHGDAKPANFLWNAQQQTVAAVDFQYTGGGPGIRDVVYLLGTDDPGDPRLEPYFERLRAALKPDVDAAALEREWRALVPVAAEDFERFLAGWGRA